MVTLEVMLDATRQELALRLMREFYYIGAQAPMDRRPLDEWIEDFRAVGFFAASSAMSVQHDGELCNITSLSFLDMRPRDEVWLYRVCTPGRQERAHWTPFISLASMYAPGGESNVADQPGAHLYAQLVQPDDILAIMGREWVIDPRGREIHDLGTITIVPPRTMPVKDLDDSALRDRYLALLGPQGTIQAMPTRTVILRDAQRVPDQPQEDA